MVFFSTFPQVKWRGMVHALSLVNSLDKIGKLRDCNCRELFMGIESGSNKIREKINKLGTIDEILTVATGILRNGIDLKGYFILGFPGEGESDFRLTLTLALAIKDIADKTNATFRTSVFQFRPYHGTKLYNELIENGIEINECKPNDDINFFYTT